MPGLDSDEDTDGEMMAVEGSDGQQYVVLEVIQLADGENEQTVAVVSGNDGEEILADEHIMSNGNFILKNN